jgi:hypothetical protein
MIIQSDLDCPALAVMVLPAKGGVKKSPFPKGKA